MDYLQDPLYGIEYVICPLCNDVKKMRRIGQHLRLSHGISVEKFREKYPKIW